MKYFEGKKSPEEFKVKEIAIFGSYLRGNQTKGSDIDILAEFQGGFNKFDNCMDIKFFLNATLDLKIDLVVKKAVKQNLKSSIIRETVYA